MRWSCALVLMVAHASAQPAVVWRAPATCPDEAALRAAIAQRLDVPVDRVDLAAEIEVTARGEEFVATVTTHGETGETRELSAASCAELTDAVAVVVARVAAMAKPVVAAAPAPAPPIAIVVPPLAPPPPPHLTWDAGARAAGVTGVGATPELGIGGEVAAWARLGDAGLELAIERWAATTADVGSGNGVSIDLSGTILRAGWFPASRRVRAWLAGELGAQAGTGFGFAMASEGRGRWSALGAGASYTYPLASHLAAIAGGEVMAATERVTFVVDNATVYRSPALVVRGRLGLEISWH